ncbi:hypothetical protein [Streptomyces sp. NPDC088915]|uniref:hypothetical protein n=1 Tax=Streptomyces sp. NPDC088915 TaxID=3365912 RepID=UPI0038086D10
MPRLTALLVPLVLLTASACVSVPAAGRPAGSPAPALAPAGAVHSSAPAPSQAPAREALVRTDDGEPQATPLPPRERARQEPAAPARRADRPGASVQQRPRTAVRSAPAVPRRPAAAPPRKKPPRRPNAAPAYDMRTLCRSAARNGVGQNIVDLCRSAYGR